MSALDWQCLIFASEQLEDVSCLLPLDEHHLIFPGKQLKDALKAWGGMCLTQPDQQCLTFAGKQPEDVPTAQGDVYLPA